MFSSSLAIVEVPRALQRTELVRDWESTWAEVAASLRMLSLEMPMLRQAAFVPPPPLRSLDAIHLASALSVAAAIDGVLVYDRRLAEACTSHGLTVASPGA